MSPGVFLRKTGWPAGSLIIFVVLCSCFLPSLEAPPCLVTSIVVVNGRNDEQYIASLVFSVVNREKSAVKKMEIDFHVYDTDGEPQPFAGGNRIKTVVEGPILPDDEEAFKILLDPLFPHRPLKCITVSDFYIVSIEYENGETWKDTYGLFRIVAEDVEVEEL